jgi:hypothetical protein
MLFTVLIFVVVAGLFVTPITYYLRSKRNPPSAAPKATPGTFKEWKD